MTKNPLRLRSYQMADYVEEITDDSPKYQKSRLDENIAESYASELKTLMEEKKPHINPDLTLPELAKKLNLSPNILSQVINGYCCQNFYNFINTYRVEEVISMMKDPLMKIRASSIWLMKPDSNRRPHSTPFSRNIQVNSE
jgi:YesN/AraC family two-component response regulator